MEQYGRAWRMIPEEKEKLIKRETQRIKRTYKKLLEDAVSKSDKENASKDKLRIDLVNTLIERAGYISATLIELEAIIGHCGMVSTYQNGENQWGTKKAPEVEIHTTMTKNLNGVMKQLIDMLPKPNKIEKGEADDGFEAFISSRSKL